MVDLKYFLNVTDLLIRVSLTVVENCNVLFYICCWIFKIMVKPPLLIIASICKLDTLIGGLSIDKISTRLIKFILNVICECLFSGYAQII